MALPPMEAAAEEEEEERTKKATPAAPLQQQQHSGVGRRRPPQVSRVSDESWEAFAAVASAAAAQRDKGSITSSSGSAVAAPTASVRFQLEETDKPVRRKPLSRRTQSLRFDDATVQAWEQSWLTSGSHTLPLPNKTDEEGKTEAEKKRNLPKRSESLKVTSKPIDTETDTESVFPAEAWGTLKRGGARARVKESFSSLAKRLPFKKKK